MTLYRKVFTKDRLPEYTGEYIWTDKEEQIYNSKGYFYDEYGQNEVEWWLEEIELGYLTFSKEDATPDFVDGINYILNKLKG